MITTILFSVLLVLSSYGNAMPILTELESCTLTVAGIPLEWKAEQYYVALLGGADD